jgi:putative Holliday junction resolvase
LTDGPSQHRKPGRRLGIDVGEVRVGVAISDPDGRLATPLATVSPDVAEVARIVDDYEIVEVVVGLPVTLAGAESAAAALARAYAGRLEQVVAPVPVTLADERMSTVLASRRLAEQGVRGRRRRQVVDQLAAAEILQGWLDTQRRRA